MIAVGAGVGVGFGPVRVFSPALLPGLALWLRAGSGVFQDTARTTPSGDGDPVGGWTDLSGLGNHASQSTSGARPVYRASVGGLPGVEFDGSDDWLSLGTMAAIARNVAGLSGAIAARPLSLLTAGTIFHASINSAAASPRFRFTFSNTANASTIARRQDSDSNVSLVAGTGAAGSDSSWATAANYAGGELRTWSQAAISSTPLASSGNTDNTDSNLVALGRAGNVYGNLIIREVLVYSRALEDWELARVGRYLMNRWGAVL
jgi:hypothetical protein